MSVLLNKQVNAKKERNFWGSRKLPQAHEKVCNENERNKQTKKKKQRARKNVIHGRKPFITPIRRTGENDLDEPRGNNYGYNEGTICLVSRSIGGKGMVFRAWAHKRTPLHTHWLVLRIGGTDLLHCWVANSTWLERAESLITKR